MKFIWEIRDSIYSPEYYKGLLTKPFSYSLKYFFMLVLCIALVVSVSLMFPVFSAVHSFLANVGMKVLEYYPDELRITIKNGVVSTNVVEPYVLPMPPEFKSAFQSAQDRAGNNVKVNININVNAKNLLVIDTKTPFTIDEFKKADTEILLTKDSAVYYDKGNTVVAPLDKVSDFTLDKGKITSFLNKAQPYFRFVYPLIAVGMFSIFFFGAAFNMFYLLFAAILILLIARMKKASLSYGKSYQLGLHLITLALIIDNLIFLAAPNVHVPFFDTIIIAALAWMNLTNNAPVEAVLAASLQA